MDEKSAKQEAVRRWGAGAWAQDRGTSQWMYRNGSPRLRFVVGIFECGLMKILGTGSSWEHAFKDADRTKALVSG